MIQRSNQLAHGLMELGIQPGDRVLVLMLNSPDILISYQGILRAGAIIVPVIFLLGPKEIAHILRNSEAKAIIAVDLLLSRWRCSGDLKRNSIV